MQTSSFIDQTIVVSSTTSQLSPLQDTPPIATADLLQAIDFLHENIANLLQAINYGHP
jgi:hypothetical protein